MYKTKKSETDWAVAILREKQEPIYYTDLINKIGKKMDRKITPLLMTSIHTRLNLDNRLVYQGEGFWYYDTNRVHKED